ncbi:PP2C family protein-serine/threonine phosphatase [Streptomyces sp. MS06]|uniref:PP2C family protein-serine/threonine phosphatase n=1 Tax=Streptomyces sp. MS06 TaxID=3385974 RepID=UPI00399FD766
MFRTRPPSRRIVALGLPTLWGAVAIAYRVLCPLSRHGGLAERIATSAVFFAVGTGLVLHVRSTLLYELRQARRVADTAQEVVLRPPPARVDGLRTAAAVLSADRGAAVGGDLYDIVATEHGVRAVMGDVRGHGIAALGTVAALLGSFREAVHDEADLAGVLHRLDRTLARHLHERARTEHPAAGRPLDAPVAEEFVTLLLLEIDGDGEVRALNCGHPWPFLLTGTRVERLARTDPLPPLGAFPLPDRPAPVRCRALLPGETLVLHTDGAEDARDARGRFFPLHATLAGAVRVAPLSPQTLLRTVLKALLRHTSGAPADDVALLVLSNDRRRGPSPEAPEPAPEATGRPHATAPLERRGA